MKEFYLRSFGTDPNGNSTYDRTDNRSSAALYEKARAEIDCNLLNRHSPDRIAPEGGEERLVFENFRVVEIADEQFGIAFEARTEAERLISRG